MEREPSLSIAPPKAVTDLLRGLASRFAAAGNTHAQWRQGYAHVIGEPADKCVEPPGYEMRPGVDWSFHFIDDLVGPLIVMAGPGGPPGWSGWDVFCNLTLEVWTLLSKPITGKQCREASATKEWLTAVYGRLADTPFVRDEQCRDMKGALWELRELTVDPFTASAKAIELFLADWGVPVEWRPDEAAAGIKTTARRGGGGRKKDPKVQARNKKIAADFQKGLDADSVVEKYGISASLARHLKSDLGKADKTAENRQS